MKLTLGIDPGQQGAIALYWADATEPMLQDMPITPSGAIDGFRLAEILRNARSFGPVTAAVENVHGMPRQAGSAAFSIGVGVIHGCLAAVGVPFTLVEPNAWKAGMGLTHKDKNASRALAAQLFPALADKFKRVRDDGRAEALLIAVYAASLT